MQLLVARRTVIDAVFLLKLSKECLAPLLRRIVVLDLFVHFGRCDRTAYDGADDIADACLGHRRRAERHARRHRERDGERHTAAQKLIFPHHIPSFSCEHMNKV